MKSRFHTPFLVLVFGSFLVVSHGFTASVFSSSSSPSKGVHHSRPSHPGVGATGRYPSENEGLLRRRALWSSEKDVVMASSQAENIAFATAAKEDALFSQDDTTVVVATAETEPPMSLLSAAQNLQTLAYRASLLGVTAVYGLQLVLPALQDAGLSSGDGTSASPVLSILAVAGTTAACLLAPKQSTTRRRRRGSSGKAILVDGKVLAASLATALAGQPLVGLAALFVREM